MFFSKSEDDADLKDSNYIVVTLVEWSFLCFTWTQKTTKGFRKIKSS